MIFLYYCVLNFLVNLFITLIFRIKISGLENIPLSGGINLCANHLSNFDPLVLRLKVKRTINFMAKKELFANKLFSYTLEKFSVFPVDRNKNDLLAYKTAVKLLNDEKVLGIFVQGTRNKNFDSAKNGAAMFAMKTDSLIIPIGIKSTYKIFSAVHINIGKPIHFERQKKIDQNVLHDATSKITEQIKKLVEGTAL